MPEEGLNPETSNVDAPLEENTSVEIVESGIESDASVDASAESSEKTAPAAKEEVVETSTDTAPATEKPVEDEAPVEEAPAAEEVKVAAETEEKEVAEVAATDDSSSEDAQEIAPAAETAEAGGAEPEASEDAEADAEQEEEDETQVSTEVATETLLQEILGDEENFEAVVEKANPSELVLLMATIAEKGNVGDFIARVGLVKTSFDSKTSGEDADQALVERFSTGLARFNKKRKAYYAEREKDKDENSAKKYALLERLKVIVQEEKVTQISDVREIQNEWREIGWVLQKDIQPLNETYRQYLDVFYQLRSRYQDLLDLDRAKNLQKKLEIMGKIEEAIPDDEGDRESWNERTNRVKELQNEWKQAGHVPRENLESVNQTYRDILDRFYEARKGYFEIQDAQREENAVKKKEFLEQLTVYTDFKSNRAKDWNEATKMVLEIQEKWKNIGPGPVEENKTLWKTYRALCDAFFTNKSTFFKSFDEQRTANLKRKVEICEKAEELQDNENFKETAKVLKDLQREWKTIGPVHERHSNKVWKRFRKACDHFFDRRSSSANSDRESYKANLEMKESLIKELEVLAASDDTSNKMDEFNDINGRWKAVGHVPFKVKDRVNNAFKEAIGKFFEKSKMDRSEVERYQLRSRLGKMDNEESRHRKVDGEVRKLQGRIRGIQEKVDQYEINIQYISKGKSGDGLRKQIQKQIDDEKARIADIKGKMKELKKMRDMPAEPKPKPEPKKEAKASSEEE